MYWNIRPGTTIRIFPTTGQNAITGLPYFPYLLRTGNKISQLNHSYFVTGIGTGIGKTLVSAILCEALSADYWKPVQAGYEEGTDRDWIKDRLTENLPIHSEVYKLKLAASPHIAAREEGTRISVAEIIDRYYALGLDKRALIVEGAGGLMVPLNEREFVADLAAGLKLPVILVSRNYLGSINHSLLTAAACKQRGIPVAGWIFNDQYLHYEEEIARWSGLPKIFSVPHLDKPGKEAIFNLAQQLRHAFQSLQDPI